MLLIDRNLKPRCLKNSPGSTMVKHSTPGPNPEVKGSNPPAGKEKERQKAVVNCRKKTLLFEIYTRQHSGKTLTYLKIDSLIPTLSPGERQKVFVNYRK